MKHRIVLLFRVEYGWDETRTNTQLKKPSVKVVLGLRHSFSPTVPSYKVSVNNRRRRKIPISCPSVVWRETTQGPQGLAEFVTQYITRNHFTPPSTSGFLARIGTMLLLKHKLYQKSRG